MSSTTTRIANLDHVVAWDESEQRHVYLDGADLVFKGNEVVHVGPGYAGPVDSTIDGKGFMAIPGALAGPYSAYIYDWNLLPIGQLLWEKELMSYKEFPPLQMAASYNLEQVLQSIKEHHGPSD